MPLPVLHSNSFPIVAQRFTVEEFQLAVNDIQLTHAFQPEFVVLHNTSVPTLAQRPSGFTKQHMENIRSGYINDNGWSSGPHLFIDDNGIWMFTPLNQRGTHSPSWNQRSWGVEMLGEYESSSFTSGRGQKIAENAAQAVAILCAKLQKGADTIHFHKEDPLTTHKHCPGKNVIKSDFVHHVQSLLDSDQAYSLFLGEKSIGVASLIPEDSDHAYTPVRPLLNAIFGIAEVSKRVGLEESGAASQLLWDDAPVGVTVVVRAPGVAWGKVRNIADWLQLDCDVQDSAPRTIRLSRHHA